VTGTLFAAYAVVAVLAALAAFIASARLGVERPPASERIGLSLAAGAVWPVILLGVAELSSFALYAKVHEHADDDMRVNVDDGMRVDALV
jgi:ribose/xylose/arabinose/galactoside ABC-type transport system permease subunit